MRIILRKWKTLKISSESNVILASFWLLGLCDPLFAFLVQLYHMGFVFLLLASPCVGIGLLAGLWKGKAVLLLRHSFLMLLYNNINSFSKDEVVFVAIDEFFLFVKKKLRVSGFGFDGFVLFDFKNFGFGSNCCFWYGVTEVFNQVHWQRLIETLEELRFSERLFFDGGNGVSHWHGMFDFTEMYCVLNFILVKLNYIVFGKNRN